MPRLLRIIALDASLVDVRRLRGCLSAMHEPSVSLQHLNEAHDAIARLPRMHADMLFIDEDLEQVTGVETIRALRAAGEVRPIVATARIDCGYLAADLVRAGADGYLAKRDLEPTMVEHVLRRALHVARGRTAKEQLRRNAVRQMIAEHGPWVAGLY